MQKKTLYRSALVLSLGSNSGNSLNYLLRASHRIPLSRKVCSLIFYTDALLPEKAPKYWNKNFLNIAISGIPRKNAKPYQILLQLKKIEANLGRPMRHLKWSPRKIDIDIAFWGKRFVKIEKLNIPHREAIKRDFVIHPTADIAPFSAPKPLLERPICIKTNPGALQYNIGKNRYH